MTQTFAPGAPRLGDWRALRPTWRKSVMRKLTRGAAALVLGSALAASAVAQPPMPPAMPPATPPAAPVVPPVTPIPGPAGVAPAAKAPEVAPTGNAAVVNGQVIPEKAVYRALRQ